MPDYKPVRATTSNPYLTAIKEPVNVGLVALTAAAIAASGMLVAAFVGLGIAELVYLVVVPSTSWYRGVLARRGDGKTGRTDALLTVRARERERYQALARMRQSVSIPGGQSQEWFQKLLGKMDYLLEKFLSFAQKQNEFRKYLRSIASRAMQDGDRGSNFVRSTRSEDDVVLQGEPPQDSVDKWTQWVVAQIRKRYDEEIAELDAQTGASTDDLHTQAVLEKRKEVIQRRRETLDQMGRGLVNITQQLELIEDTFGLISDELRSGSPDQVLADVDEVVGRADALSEYLDEVGPASAVNASA